MVHLLVGAIIGGACGPVTALAVTRLRMGIDEAISNIFLGATGVTVVGPLVGARMTTSNRQPTAH